MDPVGIVQLAELADIGDQRRFHDLGQGADDDDAPGGMVGDVSFLPLVRDHTEHLAVIEQARGTLSLFQVRLGNQRENAVHGLHQQGIAPMVAVAVGRKRNGTV